jgi:hypothetical protein
MIICGGALIGFGVWADLGALADGLWMLTGPLFR